MRYKKGIQESLKAFYMTEDKEHPIMGRPFSKSMSAVEKVRRLQNVVGPADTLGILIEADPDSMASALALRRLLWHHAKKIFIYYINRIKRADNLAFVSLLKIDQKHIRFLKRSKIHKWAIVDSQPHHHEEFMNYPFDIIIDHHPMVKTLSAAFIDIKEDYGANATIMTEYLRAAKIVPSTRLATALYYGIKTDTANFIRDHLPNDLNAFRYLHQFVNLNIVKKIESSEMTRKMLSKFRFAIDRLIFTDNMAYVHMGRVDNIDVLVIVADFFMKLAEIEWSIVSGEYSQKLIVVLRNVGLRGDAGKVAKKLCDQWGGSGGGHSSAARAEIPVANIRNELQGRVTVEHILKKRLGELTDVLR